jgi:two-component system sensor kinase FixL
MDAYTPEALLRFEPPRKSGLDVIREVPWGAHFCLLYSSPEELLEVLVPYFAQGLAANEFCFWVASEPLDVAQAEAGLRKAVPHLDEYFARGQIEIVDYKDWYLRNGHFEPEGVLHGWVDKLKAAEDRGFDGMRVTGNTFWVKKEYWESFARYEAMVDRVIGSERMIALCSYALQKCSVREIFDVIANHDLALIKEDGRWLSFKSFGRHRLERALLESEVRQRTIIEAVTDAIVAFDEAGTIHSVNSAGVVMFGYERAEIIGQDILILIPELPRMRFEGKGPKNLQASQVKSMGQGGQAQARHRGGSYFPVELIVTETRHDGARLFVGCMRDLSEQYEAEARLKQLHVERLTAMGGMAAGLAHELNQPLAASTTYLRAARRLLHIPQDRRTATMEDTLDRATEQIMRAGRIVGGLRELAAHGEPDKLIEGLHGLIRKTHEYMSDSLREKNINVRFQLKAGQDSVLADRVQIQQVLTNLIKNAIEAMNVSERRELTISTSLVEPDMVQVDVADTGPGLADEIKISLFEPAITTKRNGMGVGLPMSRMIVEAHHGKIWVQGDAGGGAVFSFTLPLVDNLLRTYAPASVRCNA